MLSLEQHTEKAVRLLLAFLLQQLCQSASPDTFCRGFFVSPPRHSTRVKVKGTNLLIKCQVRSFRTAKEMTGQPLLVLRSELRGERPKPQAACKTSPNTLLCRILKNRAGHFSF